MQEIKGFEGLFRWTRKSVSIVIGSAVLAALASTMLNILGWEVVMSLYEHQVNVLPHIVRLVQVMLGCAFTVVLVFAVMFAKLRIPWEWFSVVLLAYAVTGICIFIWGISVQIMFHLPLI